MQVFRSSQCTEGMRAALSRLIFAAALWAALLCAAFAAEPPPAYKNAALPAAARAEDLLSRMTLEEKIGQTLQAARDYLASSADIARYGLGSVLSGGGSGPAINDPRQWADMIDGYQKAALSTRLGIPIIYGVDAVHGHNNVRGAVIFPHNIGLGAANDPALVQEIGRVTALEMLATGARWNFAPCVAVPRDERWGRTYEGFGETPELVAPLGAASVRGLQSGGLGSAAAVLATPKHFAGDGGTTGGKDRGDASYSEDEFMRIHVAPYAAAIEAGARCVMVSFSSWNGEKCHGSAKLLTGILRGRLDFTGFVVSDWAGVSLLPGTLGDKISLAINAGVDMIMVPDQYARYFETMRDLVRKGAIAESRLDEAVRRILEVKFEMGLFERPFADRSLLPAVGSSAHRELARKAVAESLVVLKNSGGLLPISGKKRILVVGPKANDIGAQCGGWTLTWQGRRGPIIPGTTILEGIREAVGTGAKVEYSADGKAPKGFSPDLVIAVVGEEPYAEWEGDDQDLELPIQERKLVDSFASGTAPLLVVLLSGRPLVVSEELKKADAFVAAWLPGSEGAGVADILFGDVKASGVLPCSWPAAIGQVPVNSGDGRPCLFPAGYGIKP